MKDGDALVRQHNKNLYWLEVKGLEFDRSYHIFSLDTYHNPEPGFVDYYRFWLDWRIWTEGSKN